MKLITPFTILNKNFHEMDFIREAQKKESLQLKDGMKIIEQFQN